MGHVFTDYYCGAYVVALNSSEIVTMFFPHFIRPLQWHEDVGCYYRYLPGI